MSASVDRVIELPEAIRGFLTADAFKDLADRIQRGEAVTKVTGRYVVKVRTMAQPYYLKTLDNERRFLTLGPDLPIGLPKVVFADFTEARGILVLEMIEGRALAERREDGGLAWSVQQDVLGRIAMMQRTALPKGWAGAHDRNAKVHQYLAALSSSGEEFAKDVVRALQSAVGRLGVGVDPVISHGDLHPMNVLRSDDRFWFIDWEYAGIRPASFDPATFVIYANDPRAGVMRLPLVGGPWNVRELYEDAFVLAARQVKNWLTQEPTGTLSRVRAAVWAETVKLLAEPDRLDLR